MQNKRPGPAPVFTRRMQVRLRDDQHAAVVRVSALLGMAQSDVVRWVLDSGLAAIEQAHPEAKEEHDGSAG